MLYYSKATRFVIVFDRTGGGGGGGRMAVDRCRVTFVAGGGGGGGIEWCLEITSGAEIVCVMGVGMGNGWLDVDVGVG